MEIAIILE